MAKGALATLSERELSDEAIPYIQITSSLQAVKDIAEIYLQQLQLRKSEYRKRWQDQHEKVIASVLKEKYRTLKTQGNFNNERGLPLTVFRLRRR